MILGVSMTTFKSLMGCGGGGHNQYGKMTKCQQIILFSHSNVFVFLYKVFKWKLLAKMQNIPGKFQVPSSTILNVNQPFSILVISVYPLAVFVVWITCYCYMNVSFLSTTSIGVILWPQFHPYWTNNNQIYQTLKSYKVGRIMLNSQHDVLLQGVSGVLMACLLRGSSPVLLLFRLYSTVTWSPSSSSCMSWGEFCFLYCYSKQVCIF